MTNREFLPTFVEGCYISANGRVRAELRKPGYSAEFGCKMTRHYVIFNVGSSIPQGSAKTIKDAAARYL